MVHTAKITSQKLRVADTHFVKMFQFKNGHEVPIFDIESMHGLNQIIGHSKFNNRNYGRVYYRGQCDLYDSLMPSLFRGCKKTRVFEDLNRIIKSIINDKDLSRELHLDKMDKKEFAASTIKVEGILQHYGLPTRYLDLVDNHWVALWIGNNRFEEKRWKNKYCHFVQRELLFEDVASTAGSFPLEDKNLYQYILLLALQYPASNEEGISISNNHIIVDLRQALPSVFLRPHAQHGLVTRNKVSTETSVDCYDMSSSVVCILRLRIDRVSRWLGTGLMLTQDNLFPPAGNDCGYDLLLSRNDIFTKPKFQIARFFK